eukprot:CAMPEP_0202474802 /NCGR_PEP_ID=MMETSP1360-20130828/92505_1 /ASSEMBLY_ACC=CAM_ASM_000848 /TAXON_ID=515479 /ORGANISM="Licmophora paradoxa, Strain CCMP2313" /LENGTH=685 /DNA_ID=CAMNT_0049101943 /DNA_START=1307 /DNA_END=3364 /DNA_ORIENTATION=+
MSVESELPRCDDVLQAPRRRQKSSRSSSNLQHDSLSSTYTSAAHLSIDSAFGKRNNNNNNHHHHHHHHDDDTKGKEPISSSSITTSLTSSGGPGIGGIQSGGGPPSGGIASSDDPHAHGMGGDLTSAVLGIIKGMVGPAILYLPHGFATAGYGMALPILFITTAMFLYSSQCLLSAWKLQSIKDLQLLRNHHQHNSSSNSPNTSSNSTSNSILSNLEEGSNFDSDMMDTALLGNSTNINNTSTAISTITANNVITTSSTSRPSTPTSTDRARSKRRPLRRSRSNTQHDDINNNIHNNNIIPPPLSYPELANRALGPRGEFIVKTGIALMQSGVCLTYLIFVPQNLHTSMEYLFHLDLTPRFYLILMILVQIPLSWIRDISKLTCTNFCANCFILYGLILCLGFAFEEATKGVPTSAAATAEFHTLVNPTEQQEQLWLSPLESIWDRITHLKAFESQWYLFIGTSVLLFEGSITLLIPLQQSVIAEDQRRQFPVVYHRVILSIIAFYVFFGITCWASFGKDVHTVLTTSLPPGFMATSVQLAYSVAVILTFPLQNFPALEIATQSIQYTLYNKYKWIKNKDSFLLKRNVLTTWLVLALAVVAATAMDSLDKVVSLMGSLLGCPIAFVIPPLIHTKLVLTDHNNNNNNNNNNGVHALRKRMNTCVALMGTVAMILASIATILTSTNN